MSSTKIPVSTVTPHSDDLLQRAHRTFVGFLQGYFWSRPSGSFLWSDNDENTEVYIAGDIEPCRGRSVPSVHVVLGPSAWAGQSMDTSTNHALLENSHTFYDGVNTSVVISCVGDNEVTARYLGWLCFRAMASHKQLIQNSGTVRAIHNVFQLSSVIPAEAINKAFSGSKAVQIVVPIALQCAFDISDANNDYKAAVSKITTRLTQV